MHLWKAKSAYLLGLIFVFAPLAASTPTNVFLEIPLGPRGLAMGSTGVSFSKDPFAGYWNPANLSYLKQSGLSSSYALLDISARAYDLRVVHPLSHKKVGYGVSWSQTNFNDVAQMEVLLDSYGAIIIDPNTGLPERRVIGFSDECDNLLSGHLGTALAGGLSVGATAKLVYSVLGVDTGTGYGADLGITWRRGNFSVGSIYRNVGLARIQWADDYREQLPSGSQSEMAIRKKLNGESFLVLSAGVWFPRTPRDAKTSFRTGAEYALASELAFRFGHNGSGFTGGMGFRMGDIVGEYAFAPEMNHSAVHRLAIYFLWGKKK